MCPETPLNAKNQKGFLMPLALFILVGLGALAIAISRLSSGQFSSAVQEALSVQAFYAAESGAQAAMGGILFDVADKASADQNCTNIDGGSLNFTVAGLSGCVVTLACVINSGSGDAAVVYRIESTAVCGSGNLIAERRLMTAVRYE